MLRQFWLIIGGIVAIMVAGAIGATLWGKPYDIGLSFNVAAGIMVGGAVLQDIYGKINVNTRRVTDLERQLADVEALAGRLARIERGADRDGPFRF
jgi:hypothetical protein